MVSQKEKKGNYDSMKVSISLLCEYISNSLSIDVTLPKFSWVVNHSECGQLQSAYQVLVASSKENLDTENGDKWDSGKVAPEKSVNIIYAGSALESEKTYYRKVRLWDKDEKMSP